MDKDKDTLVKHCVLIAIVAVANKYTSEYFYLFTVLNKILVLWELAKNTDNMVLIILCILIKLIQKHNHINVFNDIFDEIFVYTKIR